MPVVPQYIIDDITELILNYIRQTPRELQVAPNLDKNDQSRLQPIEEEINVMEEVFTDVQTSLNKRLAERKRQRNSLIRFNQLPLEIPSNILWISIVNPWPGTEFYSFLHRQQAISSVCSSWQTLVKNSPRFWSVIEFAPPQAAIPHFIKKSQSSDLQIKCPVESNYDWEPTMEFDLFTEEWFLGLISPHTDRIRSLILSLSSMDGLLDVLGKPAPILEELRLDCSGCDFERPLDLFCGQASRLRDVALQNIAIEWDSGVFIGLRSLSILESIEYLPTGGQVRRLLEANPGLEKLDIECHTMTEGFGNDAVRSTGEGNRGRVVMGKMQKLRVSNLPVTLVQAVLDNVEIPSIGYLDLRCLLGGLPASSMLGPGMKGLVPPLLQLSKGAQQAELTFGERSVGLAIYTPRQHKSPTIQIELIETMPISTFNWLAENFFHAEGLPSVCAPEIFQVSLKFNDGFDMAVGTFIPILDRLNAVKVKGLTIDKWCEHGEELIKYLGETKGDFQWPLPYLTSMTIGRSAAAEIANHLLVALQRRMQYAPGREPPAAPRPVMLEILDARGLREANEDVEQALAKCVAPSGTFIPGRRNPFIDWEAEVDSDEEDI